MATSTEPTYDNNSHMPDGDAASGGPPSYEEALASEFHKSPAGPDDNPLPPVTVVPNQYVTGPGAIPRTMTYPQYGNSSKVHPYPSEQVVVTTQPYKVVSQPAAQPVSSTQSVCYLIWSLLSTIFCFLPLGIAAMVYASMALVAARKRRAEDARHKGKIALWLNVAADVMGVVIWIVIIVLFSTETISVGDDDTDSDSTERDSGEMNYDLPRDYDDYDPSREHDLY